MTRDAVGLYVHIPFCLKKCRYCDFCSFDRLTLFDRDRYVQALVAEIRERAANKDLPVDTVFFGGGTPSLLTAEHVLLLMRTLRESFHILPDAEITLEANPKTLTLELLSVYRACGINRLSIGLQSINENELKILGRIHSAGDFHESMRMIREAGFENVNVDIMYGIPEQTTESFRRTVDAVISHAPTHISAYSLILEEGTPLFKERASYTFPTEDEELCMLGELRHTLGAHGFSRYEISNYARAGFACRHNLRYWRMRPYLGFGLAAHSFFEGVRYANTTDMSEYLVGHVQKDVQALSAEDLRFEYAMLSLRTTDGMRLDEYRLRFGLDFTEGKEALLARLMKEAYLVLDGERMYLTDKGLYVSNSILTEIL